MMTILETRELRKIYGSGNTEVRALDGVNLSVEKGEFVAVVGTSGSGKSTLLHMLGGLDRPTSGTVTVDGRELSALKDEALTIFRRRKIGFVFQNYNLVPVLNVRENIILPIQLDGNQPDKAYVAQIIETLGLESKLQNLPGNLSGGQQQRVAIARMLMQRAPIMIFDDSLSAVDAETDAKIRDALDQNLGGSTVILISHRITTLMKADCILVLSNGQIAQMGTHQELISQPGIYRDIYNIQTAQEDQALLAQEV